MNINNRIFIAITSATLIYIVYNTLNAKVHKTTQTGEDEASNEIKNNNETNNNHEEKTKTNIDTEKKETNIDTEKKETNIDTEKKETNTDTEKKETNTDTKENNETEKHLSENIKFNYISFVKNIVGIST